MKLIATEQDTLEGITVSWTIPVKKDLVNNLYILTEGSYAYCPTHKQTTYVNNGYSYFLEEGKQVAYDTLPTSCGCKIKVISQSFFYVEG